MRTYNSMLATAGLIASVAALAMTPSPAAAQQLRAEIHGGWDRFTGEDASDDGLVYGVGIGVDFDLGGGFSAGIEGSADLSSIEECETSVLAAGDELCATARRDLSAVGRIGYDVGPGSRIYALAGYTNGRFRIDYTPASGAATREAEDLDGLRVGAGFQQSLGNGLYSKVEYRYSNYEAGAERHQVIAGLGLAF